jgi:hypothetical protein
LLGVFAAELDNARILRQVQYVSNGMSQRYGVSGRHNPAVYTVDD